jgi:response regulator of citrate/malate metabolism
MKQALLNLLNNALHPFGLRALTQDQIAGLSYHNSMHDLVRSRMEDAQHERMAQMLIDDMVALSSRPATLPPRRKRRGRPPMVERLTMAQVKMVRNKRLSTNRLAKKLGVTWPTANKLRDELA